MERNCKNCKNQDCFWVGADDDDICDEYLPKTNADKIRTMTDEELAWFIYTKTGCDHKCMHWKSKSCSSPEFTKVCGEVWLDWLKKECDGE